VRHKRGNPGLKGRLLDKSVEAYVLALETINCLSIKYRVETFSYLICNAWELLLKAKILEDTGNKWNIYYREQPNRSLALRECLTRIYSDANNPARRNLEKVADLRDEACHLIISKVPKNVLSLFQACVLNYHTALRTWFTVSLSERVSVGMMTIVYDFDPQDFDMTNPRLRREMGKSTADYLMRFQAEIQQQSEALGKPTEFSIDIDFSVALTKNLTLADAVVGQGSGGAATRFIEVPKDAAKTHPYRQRELIEATNELLDGKVKINTHDIQCVVRVYEVKKRPEFYYRSTITSAPTQYSVAFAQWMANRVANDREFFAHVREKAKTLHG
jgi:hypothetical protein